MSFFGENRLCTSNKKKMPRSGLFYVTLILLLSCIQLMATIKTYRKLSSLATKTRFNDYFQSTSFQTFINNDTNSSNSSRDKQIRSWGCSKSESPLIFVHIGKSGGGSARERLRNSKQEQYSFCNAEFPAFYARQQGLNLDIEHIECSATTPLSHAISCPQPLNMVRRCSGCYPRFKSCQQIYVGHNYLGTELHWLPQQILSKWWEESNLILSNHSTFKFIKGSIETLYPTNNKWCSFEKNNNSRPVDSEDYNRSYSNCSIPLKDIVEKKVLTYFDNNAVNPIMTGYNPFHILSGNMDWSFLYASLPVLRMTIVREPFSWLISKFFWHLEEDDNIIICEDIKMATHSGSDGKREIHNYIGPGWAHRYAMGYILHLCGEDCKNRYLSGISDIPQLEKQAEGNLRQSFAVVGLFDDIDTFYGMVGARVSYLNMSMKRDKDEFRENRSGGGRCKERCKKKFEKLSIQKQMMKSSEAIAAMVRLYSVAVEVNKFQVQELNEC